MNEDKIREAIRDRLRERMGETPKPFKSHYSE